MWDSVFKIPPSVWRFLPLIFSTVSLCSPQQNSDVDLNNRFLANLSSIHEHCKVQQWATTSVSAAQSCDASLCPSAMQRCSFYEYYWSFRWTELNPVFLRLLTSPLEEAVKLCEKSPVRWYESMTHTSDRRQWYCSELLTISSTFPSISTAVFATASCF